MPGQNKRSREDERAKYQQSTEDRANGVKQFILGLKFSVPLKQLRENSARRLCPKCDKKRQYYCYDCLVPTAPETHPPALALPLNVHVVLHPGEHRSKSTSLAASTISPQLNIHTWPAFPDQLDMSETALLYPSPTAKSLDEMPAEELASIKNVLFVDSTWQQSKAISRDDRLKAAKHVRIKQQVSLFWRFQNNDPTYLATVEAIYYFLKEFVTAKSPTKTYNGEVDDLLFYYVNQYITIQSSYSGKEAEKPAEASASASGVAKDGQVAEEGVDTSTSSAAKKFTTRHFADYILSNADWDEILAKAGASKDEKK